MDFNLLLTVFARPRYFIDINSVNQFTEKRRGKTTHAHKVFDRCNEFLLAYLH